MIKNIVFDMGNVLLKFAPNEYITTITEDETIAAAVLKELFYSREWLELDEGTITEEDAVSRIISRIPHYEEYVRSAMDNWHSILTPIRGMPDIVRKIKDKGYKIYLMSNASIRFFKYKADVEMFNFFDGFIISAQEKLVKPHREIFDCICERFGLAADESIFIDDLQPNIDGALHAGFHAHLFRGAEELMDFLQEQNIL